MSESQAPSPQQADKPAIGYSKFGAGGIGWLISTGLVQLIDQHISPPLTNITADAITATIILLLVVFVPHNAWGRITDAWTNR